MTVTAGNARYEAVSDLPDRLPVFPLSGALLLPNGQLPLNIFEPRYLAMINAALASDRLIGMIQPALSAGGTKSPAGLCAFGCAGRITQYGETGDGRYLMTLSGVSRFRVIEEIAVDTAYRQCKVDFSVFGDLDEPRRGEDSVDRPRLLQAFRSYLDANGMEADWESVDRASNAGLVTALSMMSPWGASEKQALLEAVDHAARADVLIAITEIVLAAPASSREGARLQ